MTSKADFEKILGLEIQARDHYQKLVEQITRENVRDKIAEIRDDEERHIKIAERLLELIQE